MMLMWLEESDHISSSIPCGALPDYIFQHFAKNCRPWDVYENDGIVGADNASTQYSVLSRKTLA